MDIIANFFAIAPTNVEITDFQHATLWALIFGACLAFLLGFGMGANDVSNTFGTSVGSKVLTLRRAYILACIFETLGAILVGGSVTDTIRKGVVDLDIYESEPKTLLLGQVAILGGCSFWLMIATFAELPVSTTQSVVGATMGFSLAVKGLAGINWWEIARIAISWVSSPVLSGLISTLLYLIVDFTVLRRKEPLEAGLRVMPIFYFFCISFNTFTVSYNGAESLGLKNLTWWVALIVSLVAGLLTALAAQFLLKPRLTTWINRKQTIATIGETLKKSGSILSHPPNLIPSSLEKSGSSTHLDGVFVIENINQMTVPASFKFTERSFTVIPLGNELPTDNAHIARISRGIRRPRTKKLSESVVSVNYMPQQFHWTPKGFMQWLMPSKHRTEDKKTLRLFSSIQVFTACFAGFAHGSNDVSNAIAPLTALLAIYTKMSVKQEEPTPIYVLLFGVVAICLGLCILGHKVIKTVGQKMSEIHAASGFTIEFGAAVTALLASKIGLPISTTHCLIGSVVCVGSIKSGQGIRWGIFRNVILSWIVTMPASAFISGGIMLLLKFTL